MRLSDIERENICCIHSLLERLATINRYDIGGSDIGGSDIGGFFKKDIGGPDIGGQVTLEALTLEAFS